MPAAVSARAVARAHIEFRVDPLDAVLDRQRRQAEHLGNHAVGLARGKQGQHLAANSPPSGAINSACATAAEK